MRAELCEKSTIGEFDCGPFRGHAKRREARPEKWDSFLQAMRPAFPECWDVHIDGENGAWVSVLLPLKRGRTLRTAISDACGMFNSPADIQPNLQGWFGSTRDLVTQPEPAIV